MAQAKEPEFTNAKGLLDLVLDLEYFKGGSPAIAYHRIPGRSRLVVMVGDNASGKSFVRRLVCAVARRNDVEPINVSMESRAGPDFTGGMRSFIYGMEDIRSTGQNSVGTVLGGIRTCEGRKNDHIIFWDEPDVGLSDSWAAGMGVAIRKFAREPPQHTRGIFLVTHSKAMVAQLFDAKAHFLYFGDDDPPKSMFEWFERPVIARDIEQLPKLSQARFMKLKGIIDKKVKRSKSPKSPSWKGT